MLTIVGRLTSGQSLLPAAPASAGQPIDFLTPGTTEVAKTAIALPEIDLETAIHLANSNAVFVDAREIGEYNAGHIRGAIVCPANDIGRWHLHMAGIDLRRRIVVYCAEASCGKGEYVASFLLANGFTNVSLYRDGWAKWTGPKEDR
jgi:rhodanese-related sulfurtransferase